MRRNEHVGARVLAVTGLLGGAAYLGWRLVASMDGSPAWLAGPFFLVELVGFLAALLLVWALWPMPVRADDRRAGIPLSGVDAVVRVNDQTEHELRATLLALRAVEGVEHVVIVDLSGRADVTALALEFQAVYAAAEPADRNGLRLIAAAVRTPVFLLLDAGDVPTMDIVRQLHDDLDDSRVAVVQGLGVSLADDSPEHGPDRRHELVFERSSLNPALGRRGAAVWTGSGSLVRAHALADVRMTLDRTVESHFEATADLHAAGWRITAPATVPVVSLRTVHDHDEVYRDRVQRVRGCREMLLGDNGALRWNSLSATQRAAALAWSVRPMSSYRRVLFLGLLCGALLAGEVPFHTSISTMAVLWLPYTVYSGVALSLLSGWSLRPGDRTRWSLHNIGATFNSGADPDRTREKPPIVNLPASQYGGSLVAAVVVLSVVLVLRGISDRLTHTMGELPQPALLAMVAVSLWLLALSLDVLRVLGRRGHRRRAARIGAALSASLGDRAVSLLDLTAFGAGVMSHAGFDVGEEVLLEAAVPTRTGVTTVVVPAVVRNVSRMPLGEYRLGVEFRELDDAAGNALAEFCLVEPAWEQMGVMPGTSVVDAHVPMPVSVGEAAAGAGRMAMRLISLLALVGAIASSLPAQVEASSRPPLWAGDATVAATGDAVAGLTVVMRCGEGAGTAERQAVTDSEGHFSMEVVGEQCRGYAVAPEGYRLDGTSTPHRLVLVPSAASAPAVSADHPGVLVAQVLAGGSATDQQMRTTLSAVVLSLIVVIAGSLLVGLRRPRRLALA